jgi:DNA-directed RNA polymerase specialized sigma24 family protein
LTLYAIRRAQFYGWYDSDTQMLSGRDFTVDDIVQHVIEKTLLGERTWDPKQSPLLPWLGNQVNSVMDAWIKRQSGKYETSFDDDLDKDDALHEGSTSSVKMDNIVDVNSPQPEQVLLEKETAIVQSATIDRVFQVMSRDAELESLFDAITETGSQKPSILAEYLQVEVTEINNRKKRFQRRLAERKR